MNQWKAELIGCTNAFPTCWVVFPGNWIGSAFLQGLTIYEMNEGNGGIKECLLGTFTGCFGLAINRQKIRQKYEIAGSCVIDCLLYSLGCNCCLSLQEFREVRMHIAKV
ncbi:unnamed protein product [Blepharisma stoltei]|uniref:Uncharacterized protein n=1 Tax=Blepharisma stoltei TaxID=1481888 RepID=A0AAU9JQ37_9CILI|nr:unnamed protein product [Blepharisma stoltei]